MATITPRSDGSLVSVFLADRLHVVVRSPDGMWSAPVALDPELEQINAGPQAARGRADMVHIAYFTDDGRIWHRRLSPDGTLSARTLIAHGAGSSRSEYGAVLPLVYNANADRLTIAYRRADGRLWERAIEGDAPPSAPTLITPIPVVTQAADSQQAGADLIAADGGLVVLFIDEETRSLFSTEKTTNGWSEPVLRAGGVDAAWVRGARITTREGEPALAYVFDAGSRGGTGLNRFGQFQPASPHE